jgi:hypothetical protein
MRRWVVRWVVRAAAGAVGAELVKRRARRVVVKRITSAPRTVANRVKDGATNRVRAAVSEGRSAAKERETSLRAALEPKRRR